MGILVNLDVMLAKRKMSSGELAERVGITPPNLSHSENRQGQGRAFFHPGRHLPGTAMPARRLIGDTRRIKTMDNEQQAQNPYGSWPPQASTASLAPMLPRRGSGSASSPPILLLLSLIIGNTGPYAGLGFAIPFVLMGAVTIWYVEKGDLLRLRPCLRSAVYGPGRRLWPDLGPLCSGLVCAADSWGLFPGAGGHDRCQRPASWPVFQSAGYVLRRL